MLPIVRRYGQWLIFAIVGLLLLFVAPQVLSGFNLNLLGRFLAYAIVALGLDLIWGYAGMLSLGQGLFFGIGAYCFAMYVQLEQSGGKLPDFMGLYGLTELPAIWLPFQSPVFALAMAILLPTALAAVLGYIVFRSRVKGVYFSIITQALTFIVSLLLIGQQQLINGTNGLPINDASTLFGHSLKEDSTKQAIYLVTVVCLGGAYLLCRWLCGSRFGRLLVALRDDENRLRFVGYNPVKIKIIVFAISAGLAGLGGVLFFPQGGIISPAAMGIVPSIEIVIWVAVGGRGTLIGAVLGALVVNEGKSFISTQSPDAWQLIMGALFVGVVLLFPAGISGTAQIYGTRLWTQLRRRSPGMSEAALAAELNPDADIPVAPGAVNMLEAS
jgi:urea transport system permease protein